jgi:4-aminobutyrate aminotransferase/4-aminobutyrate aminotransferase/(S)-3-amino-2-methylpropionate transaminase
MPAIQQELTRRRAASVARAIGSAHAVYAARADNAEIWDVEGRRYIDFCAGIAVVNTGHCHPRVVQAVQAQAALFTHTCFQVVGYESYVALAERLCALAPGASPKKALFMSTGAEAIENAVKIARHATGRPAVIAFEGAFHGRTQLGMALTGKVAPYKEGFGALGADIYHVPYPSPVHGISVDDTMHALERLFRYHVQASRVAALVVEPVQGEGGYLPAPEGFLARLRALCDSHGILLVVDEIQTGIGRAGRMFAVEHSGVEPDLITLAKGLGGGTPISAVVGRAEVVDAVPPGGLGSTYAGNPLACVAALAVLDAMADDDLCARSERIGGTLREGLRALAARHPSMADVRGLGAMTAVEFAHGGDLARPAPDIAAAVKARAAELGLLLLTCGSHNNAIRIMVPLTIPDAVLAEGLALLGQALEQAGA